jgi:site-specific recombinase XerC
MGAEAKRRAPEAARLIEARLAAGDLGVIDRPDPPTVAEYAEQWSTSDAVNRLRPATHEQDVRMLRQHWLPRIGQTRPPDLERTTLRRIVAEQMSQGIRAGTMQYRLNVLQSCLHGAREEGLIAENPASHGGAGCCPRRRE